MPVHSILSLAALLAEPDPAVFNGRLQQLAVSIPRLEAQIVVDGVLDEAPWKEAAILTGFSEYAPADGHPADDSTEVLAWYSPNAIYFAVRAFTLDAPRATLADRDRILTDDYVEILLGTFNDRRQADVFGVNPLGVQLDGTVIEGVRASDNGL